MKLLFSFALMCATTLHAGPIDVTGSTSGAKAARASTNEVLLIRTPSGAAAAVQFMAFDAKGADYRWRFRGARSSVVTTGTGRVAESYNIVPQPDGSRLVTPEADHNPIVSAGDINIEWSYGSETNGFVYFQTNRARLRILSASEFETDL